MKVVLIQETQPDVWRVRCQGFMSDSAAVQLSQSAQVTDGQATWSVSPPVAYGTAVAHGICDFEIPTNVPPSVGTELSVV